MLDQELIGQQLGNYRLDSLLGRGGMGDVYRATHISLEKTVALKIIARALAADPDFQARFQQEARAAAGLEHEHIVNVTELSQQDGRFYLVMEFMPDGTLAKLLESKENHRLPLPVGLDLVLQAADGLAFAHQKGFVHRDIKPDNLLLKHSDSVGRGLRYIVKIGDFGLVRLATGGIATVAGARMGSARYMSPEQCQGWVDRLDGRSDLYSLGVVLFEVLTGRLPFPQDDPCARRLHDVPRRLAELRPDLPAELDEIVGRCLARDAADRFPTVLAFIQALSKVADREVIDDHHEIDERVPNSEPPTRPLTIQPREPVEAAELDADKTRVDMGNLLGREAADEGSADTLLKPTPTPELWLVVLDSSGHETQVFRLGPGGLAIGRGEFNNVVLEDERVSRTHARVEWDGERMLIQDCESKNKTWLGSHDLIPDELTVWPADETVRVGHVQLRWRRTERAAMQDRSASAEPEPHQPARVVVRASPFPPAHEPVHPPQVDTRWPIRIALDQPTLTITPGQPDQLQIGLTNAGARVEFVRLRVEGVRSDWVMQPEGNIRLEPGENATVSLPVNVAAVPGNLPGNYDLTISAVPTASTANAGTARAHWIVLPFTKCSVRVMPESAGAYSSTAYAVRVRNEGNVPAQCTLSVDDPQHALGYRMIRQVMELTPGATATVQLVVKTGPIWFGEERRLPFTVTAGTAGVGQVPNAAALSYQSLRGSAVSDAVFVHRPLGVLNTAALWLLMFLLVGFVAGLIVFAATGGSVGAGAIMGVLFGAIGFYPLANMAVSSLASPRVPVVDS